MAVDYNLTQKLKLLFEEYKDDFILGRRTTTDLMPSVYKALQSYFDSEFTEKINIDYYKNEKLLSSLRSNLKNWNMARNYHQTNELINGISTLQGVELETYMTNLNTKYFSTWLDTEIKTIRNSVENINSWDAFPDSARLMYSTAGDGRVRDEHAALDGMVLPKSDPRWYYLSPPPASSPWNCRCRLIPVWEDSISTDVTQRTERMAEDMNKSVKDVKANSNAVFSGKLFDEKTSYFKNTPDWVYSKLNDIK